MKTREEFDVFLSNMSKTNRKCNSYMDFEELEKKISKNIDGLNLMNSLVGHKYPKKELKRLMKEYGNKVIHVIPILIALRKFENKKDNFEIYLDEFNNEQKVIFDENENLDNIIEFISKIGLLDFFQDKKIKSVLDYAIGIEAGISTNARKNKSGKIMESIVGKYFEQRNDISYIGEQVDTEKLKKLGYFVEDIKINKKAIKRFDFAFLRDGKLFVVETNYYGSGGSKLNETARSYIELNNQIANVDNVEFIWITDGQGWNSVKGGLFEAYTKIEHLYNLHDIMSNI